MPAAQSITQAFILHWGEMGTRWGINRTVAQIHALLYLSPQPLPADEIAAALFVARSNVSNSLHELQAWGIVRLAHVMGDRRDHYESMKDVWEMFQIILDERKKREIDPTLQVLRQLTADAKKGAGDPYVHERLKGMLGFFETMTGWYAHIRRMPAGSLLKFVKMGDRIKQFLGGAS